MRRNYRTLILFILGTLSIFDLIANDQVTIYRDAWGVPHIHGKTDKDAAFGMAYAQAEDNFAQLEYNFILAIGRSAELFGEETILSDWVVHSFEVVELSKRDYENASADVKALLDGYAAGLNYYLQQHPNVKTRLLTQFEPWYPLALIRRMYYLGGFLGRLNFTTAERLSAYNQINKTQLEVAQNEIPFYPKEDRQQFGSNSWAATGSKIEGTGSYLFINPHLPAFGMGQVYEAHLISDSGWNFSGYSRFGFPLVYVGFGKNLGWASTDNYGDQEDAWIEHFNHDTDPLSYQYGDGYKKARIWSKSIKVAGKGEKKLTFMKNHRGPIVASRDNHFISARLATYEEPGWLDQWYDMTKAQSFQEFQQAASRLKMQFGNYMYADREGNIYFVYNGAFPKKSTKFNWNQPVDGRLPETDWLGYHSLDEIPQVLNPKSLWMQNTNTTPFMTSMSESDPESSSFPYYMVRESDNARSKNARRILTAKDKFSFSEWEYQSLDTTLMQWLEDKDRLMRAYSNLEGQNNYKNELEAVIEMLSQWGGESSLQSVETTLYVEWHDALFTGKPRGYSPSDTEMLTALVDAKIFLEKNFGDWKVAWGKINRAQRAELDEKMRPKFCDQCDSIGSPAVPGWAGGSLITFSRRQSDLKYRYKNGGNSYTAIIDFPKDPSQPISAKSVHVFGASSDPESKHFIDQANLLADKKYKPAWLSLKDVKKHAQKVYHPGQE